MDVTATLRAAFAHHKAGRLAEAERGYRQVLRAVPHHPIAATLLARLALRAGAAGDAGALARQALRRAPGHAPAWSVLGDAAAADRRSDEAMAAWRRALCLDPGLAEAWFALADSRLLADRPEPARAFYRRGLAIRPGDAAAATNLAGATLRQGDAAAALALLDGVLHRRPAHVRALAYRHAGLRLLGRDGEADCLTGHGRLTRPAMLAVPPGYRDHAAFNRALAAEIRAQPDLSGDWDPLKRAIRGGAILTRLFGRSGPALAGFETALRAAVAAWMAGLPNDSGNAWLARRPDRYDLDGWANILGEGDHQSSHIHNLGWMSGVYYVALPETVCPDDPARAGWLEFDRPGYGLPDPGRPCRALCPAVGMAVFFPSHVWHRTIPFHGGGERISIAFDLHPQPGGPAAATP